jgi:hypothetical protein
MNDTQREVFEQKFDELIARGFLYCGENAIANFRKYVAAYIDTYNAGRVSESAFDIVLREMLASGDLKPIVVADDKSAEIQKKIADFDAGKISVYEFRLACKANRELRDAYEQHTGLAQLAPGR